MRNLKIQKIVVFFIIVFFCISVDLYGKSKRKSTRNRTKYSKKVIKQLKTSIKENDMKTLKKIIRKYNGIINYNMPPFKLAPLHEAANNDNLDAVKLLLSYKANPNIINGWQMTPLHYAASSDKVEMVQLLLDKGASANATDYFGNTPLSNAKKKTNKQIIALLEKVSKNKGNGLPPLIAEYSTNLARIWINNKKRADTYQSMAYTLATGSASSYSSSTSKNYSRQVQKYLKYNKFIIAVSDLYQRIKKNTKLKTKMHKAAFHLTAFFLEMEATNPNSIKAKAEHDTALKLLKEVEKKIK